MASTNKHKRISASNAEAILADLAKWAAGDIGVKLTWAILEERHGFSRQALQAKPEIKAAYLVAKKNLASGRAELKRDQAVSELSRDALMELECLREQLREYERKEALWKIKWQQIAYHVRARGMQVSKVDAPIPEGAAPPSEQETAEILHIFNEKIPASGQT
ncbi:hypothetical protein [Herbaspirillum huttiense]|uniref:hypothetical protein n=1 Tax=Herbaspirillum huttiense TaxID=863372 RepID=UPI002176A7AA|nr:hypothetical protein [Herbaspirillum huttiense]UWE15672.1 hypothetical protein NY669_21720 [Herbaspirillum huttiense]